MFVHLILIESSSDGPQPHYITIEFPRRVAIQVCYLDLCVTSSSIDHRGLSKKLSIHLSFTLDDSYTPATLAVRAGTSPMDLQDIRIVTLEKPDGWYTFDVSAEPNDDGDGLCVLDWLICSTADRSTLECRRPVHAYLLQIIIVANHMNGKDTHVRGLKVLGPLEYVVLCLTHVPYADFKQP